MSLNEDNLKVRQSNLKDVNDVIARLKIYHSPSADNILCENNFVHAEAA